MDLKKYFTGSGKKTEISETQQMAMIQKSSLKVVWMIHKM